MTAATIGHASKPKSKRASSLWAENLSSFWFLLPIIIIFFILTVVPLAQSFFYSLTDYDGYSENFSFVAFSNYVAIFKDPSLLSALGFTLLYAFGTTLLVTCFAIPLAVTLNKAMWGRSFARSLFFFLGVPAQAIIGLIWQYIFSPLGSGVMNKVIAVFGIPNIPWLADDNWARFCVIFVAVWMQVGWHATLYLAYLQTIPADLYEQARVDGANSRQQFFHITLPQLIPGIVVSMFLLMDRRTENLRSAVHLDRRWPRIRHQYAVPGHHPQRYRPKSVRTGLGVVRMLHRRLHSRHRRADRHCQRRGKEVPMTPSQRELVRKIFRTIVVLGLALICAVPLYYVIVSSFKTSIDMIKNPLGLPEQWTLENYKEAFADGTIIRAFVNTLIVTVVAVLLQVLVGSMAAFGVVYKKSKFTAIVGGVLMVTFAIPVQATMLPLYRMESETGLVDSLLGLIVLYMGSCVFCYFLIVGYMKSLPQELFEAAKIDGAGPWRIYSRIVLPLITPILTTVVVFQTMGTWNDFLLPSVFLSSTDNQTVVLQVYNAVQQFSTNWPLFMTITVLALVPVFIFFCFCQKWIVSGLVAGSVKG